MKNRIIKVLSVITIFPILMNIIIKQRKKSKLRKKILSDGESFTETAINITNSIGKSKDLYKKLIVKVHPDRFFGEKKTIANELSAKITKSKKNYKELLELKTQVDDFLSEI